MDIAANRQASKYTRSEQFARVLWAVAGPLFRFSPRPFFAWRRWLLRRFGATIGSNVNIYPSAVIAMPWNLEVGDFAAIGERAQIYNLGHIKIGRETTISQGAHLCAGTHDYTDAAMPLLKPPIAIGPRVWICADAFVGPGITVGEGAVVGARAVAMRSVPEWAVVSGNPAKVIKQRRMKDEQSA